MLAALLVVGNQIFAQHTIVFFGKVEVVSGGHEDVHLVVYGDKVQAQHIPLSRNGKFAFEMPVDQKFVLRCSKPGYLTKRIHIDTENAYASQLGVRKNRGVDFDIELLPQRYKHHMEFASPVAQITFNERSGLLKIRYCYRKQRILAEDLVVDQR